MEALAQILTALRPTLGEADGEPEALPGGITNRNVVVRFEGRPYVVRLPGARTAALGIDRVAEWQAAQAAERLGIGPHVAAFLPEHGSIVTTLLAAEPLGPSELRRVEVLDQVADALAALHRAPALRASFSPFRVVEEYREAAAARGVTIPPAYDVLRRHAGEIKAALRGPEHDPVPCHNDLLGANLLWDGTRVRIVDWEYAGMGDRYFDLANLCVNNQLEPWAEGRLLHAYFADHVQPRQHACVALMKIMSDFREAMWGVLQSGLSDLEEDFAGYAQRHFERALASVRAPGYRHDLEEALAGAP